MSHYLNQKRLFVMSVFLVILFSGCQKDFLKMEESGNNQTKIQSSVTGAASNLAGDLPGRTLAANCFQCHGTNGYAGELKIASMGASEMINKFNSYKTKAANADIMYLHAQSYTTAEIQVIADFFSKQ